jgi:hypothetical protein
MHDWADLTTLNLPEYLAPSYALALQEQIKANTFVGFKGEDIEMDGVQIPSMAVVNDDAFKTWHAETLAMFDALTLPAVATVANFMALPFFTPSLLFYLRRSRKASVQKASGQRATEPKKKKPSKPPVEASEEAPATTESQEEPERALVAL